MEKDPILEKIDLGKIRANIPGWQDVVAAKDLDIKEFTVCLTNKLYGLTNKKIEQDQEGGDNGKPSIKKRIIYRIFGKMQVPLLDRPFENEIMGKLAEVGLAPKIYYSDETIRMEEFIYGRDILDSDKQSKDLFLQVNSVMARFHNLFRSDPSIRGPQRKWLLARMVDDRFLVDYIASLTKFKDRPLELKTKEFVKKYITPSELDFLSNSLKRISHDPHNDVICHNDIHWGNILFVEPKTYYIIDYEYASYNPRAADIANFFNEFNFSYGEKEPPYFTCDVSRFPTEAFIYEFCLYYCFFSHCPREPTKDLSNKSFEDFVAMLKTRNLFEALDTDAKSLVKEVYILGMHCNYFWILVFILTYNDNDFQIEPESYINARIVCYEFFKAKVNLMYKDIAVAADDNPIPTTVTNTVTTSVSNNNSVPIIQQN